MTMYCEVVNYDVKRAQHWIHIALWIAYIITYAGLWGNPQFSFLHNLVIEICLLPFKVALVYISILYLVPRFLFRKHYVRFALYTVAVVFTAGILHQLYVYFILTPGIIADTGDHLWNWERLTKRMTYLNTPMLFAITLVVLDNFYQQKEMNARMAHEKLSAELKLLKNQLHPHFFFNTLNNLYSLALKKSDHTPEVILKLSSLMRYTLEKNDQDKVLLSEEIDFIQNYVAIEQLRFQERVNITWHIDEMPQDIAIPPFLLSTFVENAFKHGVAKSREKICIDISLRNEARKLVYSVYNDFKNDEKSQDSLRSGVGLRNLQQRLSLLFGNDHTFAIDQSQGFLARFTIPIT